MRVLIVPGHENAQAITGPLKNGKCDKQICPATNYRIAVVLHRILYYASACDCREPENEEKR